MTSSAFAEPTRMDIDNANDSESNHSSGSSSVAIRGGQELYSCPRCGNQIPLPPLQKFQGIFQFVQDHLSRCPGPVARGHGAAVVEQPQATLDLLVPIQPRRAWTAEDSRRKKLEEDPDAYDVTPHSVTCAGCHRPIRLNGTGRYYAANWNKHKMGCKNTHASNSSASRSMESKFNGRVAAFRVTKPPEGVDPKARPSPSSAAKRRAPVPSSNSSQASTSESGSIDIHPPPTTTSSVQNSPASDTLEYYKRWSDTYLLDRRNSADGDVQHSPSLRRANSRSSPAPSARRYSQSSSTRASPGPRTLRKEVSEVRAAPYRYGSSAENTRGSGNRYSVSHAGSQQASPVISPEPPLTARPTAVQYNTRLDDRPSTGNRRHRPLSLQEKRRTAADDHPYLQSRTAAGTGGYSASTSHPSEIYALREDIVRYQQYDRRMVDPRDPLAHLTVIPLSQRRQPGNYEPLYSPRPNTPLSAPSFPTTYSSTSPSLHATRNERKRKSMDDIFYADIEALRLPDLRGSGYSDEQPRYSLPPFKSLDLPAAGRQQPVVRPERTSSLPHSMGRKRAIPNEGNESTDDDSDRSMMARYESTSRKRYGFGHGRIETDSEVEDSSSATRLFTHHRVSEERLTPRLHPVWKWDGQDGQDDSIVTSDSGENHERGLDQSQTRDAYPVRSSSISPDSRPVNCINLA
ncbi:hypothetical protein SCHPADRAFT_664889 [Schizopora paradoxa]|uniref:Uncharacterized protein n=1 Tax=Schizopora paradoxa TaxID=27342 RepID=A0A0H2R5M6_9AGAM|nr:hypothetical protein SCHPADRAFT_664889 [Schizopora paradoxa]